MAVIPGVTYIQNWKGDNAVTVPGVSSTQAASFQNVEAVPPLSEQQALIAQRLSEMSKKQYLSDASKSHPSVNWVKNPIGPVSEDFMKRENKAALSNVYRLSNDIHKINARQTSLKKQAENLEKVSETTIGSLFSGLVGAALDFAKEQLNKLLPPQFKFDVNMSFGPDGAINFGGFGIGDIKYDAKENTVNYSGNTFNALAQSGLGAANKMLPDFLQIKMDSKFINLNNITIDLDDLRAEPGKRFDLGNNVGAVFDGNQFSTFIGNQAYKIGTAAAGSFINQGLSGFNKMMPAGLQANIQFPSTAGLPILEIGFMKFDMATGALAFNSAGAQSLVNSQLDKYVFNQLPAPIAGIARSIWKSVNLGNIFGFNKQPIRPSPANTLNAVGEASGTPSMAIPTSGLGAPGSANPNIQDTQGAYGNFA